MKSYNDIRLKFMVRSSRSIASILRQSVMDESKVDNTIDAFSDSDSLSDTCTFENTGPVSSTPAIDQSTQNQAFLEKRSTSLPSPVLARSQTTFQTPSADLSSSSDDDLLFYRGTPRKPAKGGISSSVQNGSILFLWSIIYRFTRYFRHKGKLLWIILFVWVFDWYESQGGKWEELSSKWHKLRIPHKYNIYPYDVLIF